jgi:hypothetical protein
MCLPCSHVEEFMTSQAHRAYEAKLALKSGRQVAKRLQEAVEDAQLDYNLVSYETAYRTEHAHVYVCLAAMFTLTAQHLTLDREQHCYCTAR